jgi:hypothetical protein
MRRTIILLSIFACLGLLLAGSTGAEEGVAPKQKGLLVVAPDKLSKGLGDFVAYKQKQLPTELVSLESVLKSTQGADDAEKLKRYLYDRWHKGSVGYALLVGDVDVMPVRYMVLDRVTPAAFDYAFYPSDLYYSDLAKQDGSFDDWNAKKDGFHAGYYGEVRGEKNKHDPMNYDEVDYRPDMAVGRWPVDTEDEVRLLARKTIRYEQGAASGEAPGCRCGGFFCTAGWVDARAQLDALASHLPDGWRAEKRYYSDGSRNDTAAPDEAHLIELLNKGVGFVVHAGHGSDTCWDGCLSTASLDKLTNSDRLPVLMSTGCSTAYFAALPPYEGYTDKDGVEHKGTNSGEVFTAPPPPPAVYQTGAHNPTGLGEQLLRHGPQGAVAYIGCDTGSQPCALTLLEGFVKALSASRAPRLGDCWVSAVSYYYDHEHLATLVPDDGWYPASIFFQGMKFMLFGDPSLRMPEPVVWR